MEAYRTESHIDKDGELHLSHLPFHKGEKVEVIVLRRGKSPNGAQYPLRGEPIRYEDPTAPVAESDWEALQ